jgi:hypothetical protein
MLRYLLAITAAAVLAAGPVFAFDLFDGEAAAVSDLIRCPNPKITSDVGLPDLWSCVFPGADVVKVFINEDGNGSVENVKVMWNDWTRDTGYGVHADKEMAEAWVTAIATRFAPEAVDRVLDAFRGNADASIAGDGHILVYTYSKGPAIDERLITITASEPSAAASPPAQAYKSVADISGGVSLICRNPQREYNLVYVEGTPAVVVNPDSESVAWPVLSVLFDDRQHIVIADLEQPGMAANVHLRPYLKDDIFSSGEMVQTDGCYAFT